jgi:hypothetical protein
LKVPPEIFVHTHRVEQLLGQDARFECRIKANPLINFYWMKNDKVIESLDNSVLQNSVETHQIIQNTLNNDYKKSSKYETLIYTSHDYLTSVTLVVRVKI